MHDDRMLLTLARQVGISLSERGLMLASAESCTGGWLGQTVTSIAGSSAWYDRGFITYSNRAKQQMLGVQAATLSQYGAVSEQTAKEMAAGVINMSDAQVSVAVTGIAGPTGGSKEKPVGMVCLAWAFKHGLARSKIHFFSGDREAIRRQSVSAALMGIIKLLEDMPFSLA